MLPWQLMISLSITPVDSPYPCSQAIADLLSVSTDQVGHLGSLTQMERWVWYLLLSMMVWDSSMMLSILDSVPSPFSSGRLWCRYSLLSICLFTDIYIVSQFPACVNKAPMNIHRQIFVWTYVYGLCGWIPRIKIIESHCKHMFNFVKKLPNCFSKGLYHLCFL